jgi:hypothetical protein
MRVKLSRAHALVGVIVLGVVAATASPASAGKTPLSAYCGFAPSTFDSVALLTSGIGGAAGARGDDVAREPSLTTPYEVPASAKGKGGPNFKATVDTFVHVVSDGQIGNVSDTAIQQQMTVLNMGFGGMEGGYNTGFKFKLAGVDRTSNAGWHYAGPGTSDERAMKKALHKGDATDLNIYFTTAGAYLGWPTSRPTTGSTRGATGSSSTGSRWFTRRPVTRARTTSARRSRLS